MRQVNTSKKDIMNYYDESQILYNLFYSVGSLGLHYGFWFKDTKDAKEAILNTNKFLVNKLNIKAEDVLLDAGCGIGGSSFYISQNTGATCYGITLSGVQLKQAVSLSKKYQLSDKTKFSLQDFTDTNFKDESFSVVFGIESICHAFEKLKFVKEAFRVLKKGGRIAVVDAFRVERDFTEKENSIYNGWLKGWEVPNLSTVASFKEDLRKAGFRKITFIDMFENVRKSSLRIYFMSLITYPFGFLFWKLGLFTDKMYYNSVASLLQKEAFNPKNPMVTYGVFIAEK